MTFYESPKLCWDAMLPDIPHVLGRLPVYCLYTHAFVLLSFAGSPHSCVQTWYKFKLWSCRLRG